MKLKWVNDKFIEKNKTQKQKIINKEILQKKYNLTLRRHKEVANKIYFAKFGFQRSTKRYEYLVANNGDSLGEVVISASSKLYIREKIDLKITENKFETY
jgi:hypothetical protein